MSRPRGISRNGATIKYLAIIAKDPCPFCGKKSTTTDHIEPKRFKDQIREFTGFGINHWTNFAPCCAKCNNAKKGNLRLLEFLRRGGLRT